MSDSEFTDDEIEDLSEDQDDDSSIVRNLRKQLRKAKAEAKANGELAEQGRVAARKLALMDAGIDLSTGTGRLFADAYKGDLETDAIKSAAKEYGLIKDEEEVPAEEAQALQRASEITAGGPNKSSRGAEILAEFDPRQLTREEFWAKARSRGLVAD